MQKKWGLNYKMVKYEVIFQLKADFDIDTIEELKEDIDKCIEVFKYNGQTLSIIEAIDLEKEWLYNSKLEKPITMGDVPINKNK